MRFNVYNSIKFAALTSIVASKTIKESMSSLNDSYTNKVNEMAKLSLESNARLFEKYPETIGMNKGMKTEALILQRIKDNLDVTDAKELKKREAFLESFNKSLNYMFNSKENTGMSEYASSLAYLFSRANNGINKICDGNDSDMKVMSDDLKEIVGLFERAFELIEKHNKAVEEADKEYAKLKWYQMLQWFWKPNYTKDTNNLLSQDFIKKFAPTLAKLYARVYKQWHEVGSENDKEDASAYVELVAAMNLIEGLYTVLNKALILKKDKFIGNWLYSVKNDVNNSLEKSTAFTDAEITKLTNFINKKASKANGLTGNVRSKDAQSGLNTKATEFVKMMNESFNILLKTNVPEEINNNTPKPTEPEPKPVENVTNAKEENWVMKNKFTILLVAGGFMVVLAILGFGRSYLKNKEEDESANVETE